MTRSKLTLDHPTRAGVVASLRTPVREVVLQIALTRFERAFTGLAAKARPSIQTLTIEQDRMVDGEGDWLDSHDCLGDHATTDRVFAALPGLRALHVVEGWDIFETIAHPQLETITIDNGMPCCTYPRDHPAWNVPALRRVAWCYQCDCTGTGATVRADQFEPLWRAHAPALREVDLTGSYLHVRPGEMPILDETGFQCMLARLEILRLPYHAVGRSPAQLIDALRRHAPRLAHLRELALSAIPNLARAERAELVAIVPGLAIG